MQFIVSKSDRADRLVRDCQFFGSEWMSRSSWEDLFCQKKIRSEKLGVIKSGDSLSEGDLISIDLPFSHSGILTSKEDVELLYQSADQTWGVFFKKSMLNSISLRPWLKDSLASEVAGFLERGDRMSAVEFSALAEPPILEGGLVQRLDFETSGLLSVAFTKPAKYLLQKIFRENEVKKTYLAIVEGESIQNWKGNLYLLSEKLGYRAQVSLEKVKAESSFSLSLKVCSKNSKYALIIIEVNEGFRHVVRASMSALGFPLYADAIYGHKVENESFYLHAFRLVCPKISLNIETLPPQSFLSRLESFGLNYRV